MCTTQLVLHDLETLLHCGSHITPKDKHTCGPWGLVGGPLRGWEDQGAVIVALLLRDLR
jgi:hypothetical protein